MTTVIFTGLEVWWVSNPPHKGERYPVQNVEEAIKKLWELAERDLALGDLVFANAGGLEYQNEAGEWEEYHDENDDDIDQIIARLEEEK